MKNFTAMSNTVNAPQIPGTTGCNTCYGTTTVDQGGKEINCPDCPVAEFLESFTVATVWQNTKGREFTRTKSYRAAWVADAMDMALDALPDSAVDIVDQWMV
jgi:hypothetical protein